MEMPIITPPISRYNTSPFLAYALFPGPLEKLLSGDKLLVSTLNQYSFCIAEMDLSFKKALQESEVLLPDGVAITAAARFLNGEQVPKIAGADLHHFLLDYLNKKAGSCFYLGSSQDTLNKIENRLAVEFPNIRAGFYSPPYKAGFSEADSQSMLEAINAFEAEVLFIGMTAPKQEKWAHAFHPMLNARITCCIGAVFDFYAGSVNRPGKIWIKLGLEWLGRLLKEPKRLWKRYLYYGPIFVFRILKEKFKNKSHA